MQTLHNYSVLRGRGQSFSYDPENLLSPTPPKSWFTLTLWGQTHSSVGCSSLLFQGLGEGRTQTSKGSGLCLSPPSFYHGERSTRCHHAVLESSGLSGRPMSPLPSPRPVPWSTTIQSTHLEPIKIAT